MTAGEWLLPLMLVRQPCISVKWTMWSQRTVSLHCYHVCIVTAHMMVDFVFKIAVQKSVHSVHAVPFIVHVCAYAILHVLYVPVVPVCRHISFPDHW